MAISEELRIVVKAEVNKAVANLKKLQGQTKKNEGATKKYGGELKRMALGFATATTAILAMRKAWQFASEAAKLAAESNQVAAAFENMAERAGASADAILAAMDDAANGTISKLSMMKAANRAALFDIPMDQLDELMQIANASATAMGESVEFMFDSIVTGIGRASPLILDNLGLQIKATQALENYAGALGKSVDELTETEKRQATLNEVLRTGADLMEKVGEAGQELTDLQKWESMTAALVDFKTELGQNFVQHFADAAHWISEMVRGMTTAQEQLRTVRQALKGDVEDPRIALEAARAKLERGRLQPGEGAMLETLIAKLERMVAAEERLMTSGMGQFQPTQPPKVGGGVGGAEGEIEKIEKALVKTVHLYKGATQAEDDFITLTPEATEAIAEQAEAVEDLAESFLTAQEALEMMGTVFEGAGAAMIEGASALGNALKGVIVQLMRMVATELQAMALVYAGLGQMGKAAAALAGSIAASMAAGLIGAIAFAEGGIVTRPTLGLVGEAGPEAVIPLSKMGGMGDTIIIQGDLLTQEEAYSRVTEYQQRRGRSW